MQSALQLADGLLALVWTMLRVAGVVMLAPILGAMYVPARVRILITAVLAMAILPVAGGAPPLEPLSAAGLGAIARELALGAALGFVLKLATESALLAGQLIATSMGLSFATVVDPQNGGMPLLGRFYIILASLLLLATNAHLTLIALLARSYELLPLGHATLTHGGVRALVEFGGLMFAGALQLSLPAVVAILMINIAFGVISRAAPTLNLFAVGFPITILMGLFVLVLSIRGQGPVWEAQSAAAFGMISRLLGAG